MKPMQTNRRVRQVDHRIASSSGIGSSQWHARSAATRIAQVTVCLLVLAWLLPGAAASDEADDAVGSWDGWMTLRADNDDDASSQAVLSDDAVALGGISFPSYECDQLANCPPFLIREEDGRVAGCTRDPSQSICWGTCRRCQGSANPVRSCRPRVGFDCAYPSSPTPTSCGYEVLYDCHWASTPPPGFGDPTPNQCYCSAEFGWPTLMACKVRNCTTTL